MTSTITFPLDSVETPRSGPVLDVVVPVHNEEVDLEPCVRRLHRHLSATFPYTFRITIADNASIDATPTVAARLADDLPSVRSVRLEQKGRGRALHTVWSDSDADVLAYMDVDLSTDLNALLPLVAPLISGHSDLAIGSRLAHGSRVVRGAKREFISRSYNMILRRALHAGFSDAQCGFKAIRADVAAELLPLVEDTGWFFDTELLVLAERSGLRVHEVPVDWVDDPDSRVHIVSTATADLQGVARLLKGFVRGSIPVEDVRRRIGRPSLSTTHGATTFAGQLARFAAIGAVSTAAYAVLFVLLHQAMGAQAANLLALLLTAVANTAANRRLTFGIRDAEGRTRQHLQALLVFALGLGLTAGSLATLHAVDASPARWVELAVLVGANLVTTIIRFLFLRSWVFPHRRIAPENPS
jgi:glycosyltransferase involved in cell wall biosynthesis/putative flippase GtrA